MTGRLPPCAIQCPLAGPALPTHTARLSVGIARLVGMAPRARGTSRIAPTPTVSPQDIFPVRDDLEVPRIHASRIAAHMVKRKPVRYLLAALKLVRDPMRAPHNLSRPISPQRDQPIAVSVAGSAPWPARVTATRLVDLRPEAREERHPTGGGMPIPPLAAGAAPGGLEGRPARLVVRKRNSRDVYHASRRDTIRRRRGGMPRRRSNRRVRARRYTHAL